MELHHTIRTFAKHTSTTNAQQFMLTNETLQPDTVSAQQNVLYNGCIDNQFSLNKDTVNGNALDNSTTVSYLQRLSKSQN